MFGVIITASIGFLQVVANQLRTQRALTDLKIRVHKVRSEYERKAREAKDRADEGLSYDVDIIDTPVRHSEQKKAA